MENNMYNVDNLFVGNLCWFPNEYVFIDPENFKITDQKYIFQKINETEYKEVFTGISMIEWPELSSQTKIPYVVNLKNIVKYIPEFLGKADIDSADLLIALDIINTSSQKEENSSKRKKLSFDGLLVPKK